MRLVRLRGCVALLLVLGALAPALAVTAAEHVVHISMDGLSSLRLQQLIAADTNGDFATFERLLDEGASSWNARTDYTHTITLPNHTSMLTGRPVQQVAGQPNTLHHGWTTNVDPLPGVTLHNGANPNLAYVASTFDVVHDHGLSTALYVSKSKFVLYEQSYDAADGAPDALPPDHGRDKIDVYVNDSAASMHAALLSGLAANHYAYAFVHYSSADDAGHASGWSSTAYANALRTLDDRLAQLLLLIETDPILAGRTLVILSADHGGDGTSHDSATLAANYTIPFFVWGAGAEPGADLYALNPDTRADPGTARPSYGAALQPIRNGDGGNLALAALGLGPVPGSSIDAAQDLAIASPAEIPLLSPIAALALALLLPSLARTRLSRAAAARRGGTRRGA